MIYLKSIAIGLATAFVTALLWIFVSFVLPVFLPVLLSRFTNDGAGVFASAAVIGSGSILIAAALGFIAGVGWTLLRRETIESDR